jgi:transcriptional regulator with PAS, ATPase and Fis domain
MNRKLSPSTEAAGMRRRAEARLRERRLGTSQARTEADTQRLVHELEVHQVELEMQNEELQKARDEATSALEMYSDLYDFAPMGYLTLDCEGTIREANLAAAGLLETERSRLLKQRFGRFVAVADRPTFRAFLTRVFKSQAREFCEVTLRKEGKPLVEVRIAGAVAAAGRECRVVLEDVTVHNRAEAVLRRSQEEAVVASRSEVRSEHDKLWKLASNPFIVLGEARVTESGIDLTVLGDLPAEPRLGLAPGSFPKTIEAAVGMLHPDDRPAYQAGVERSQVSGEPFDMNYRLADGQGGWRWIEGRAMAVEVQEGRPLGWVFTCSDITQRQQSEAALHQSRRELHTSRFELKSEQDRLWKLAANAFSVLGEAHLTEEGIRLEYFGDGTPETKVGLVAGTAPKTMADLLAMMHPDDVKSYQQRLESSLATGEPHRAVYRLSDGRGGWRWLQARAIAVEERDGNYVRWLHDNIDITEQKETEEALRQSVEELRQLKARLQNENLFLREEVDQGAVHRDLVGRGAALTRVLDQVELVSATSSTVLVSGETGTGKKLVARAIHQRSDRQKRLFVAVNCAALPATLVESELFGHEKGAFTGATARRVGRFEQADGGTLFLDEVGELPLETQAKMLRVLQSGEFERVGGSRPLKTNARVIAASNRDLEQAVRDGRFRSDLYHRLAIFPIHLPPLRERREDIPLLAAYLVTRKARQLGRNIERISSDILDLLTAYDWPGNVRELENVLERAIILSPRNSIGLQAVQLGSAPPATTRAHHARLDATAGAGESDTLQAHERAHILRICQATAWKIKGPDGAASKLGLNPGTLYWRMKKLGIQRPAAR